MRFPVTANLALFSGRGFCARRKPRSSGSITAFDEHAQNLSVVAADRSEERSRYSASPSPGFARRHNQAKPDRLSVPRGAIGLSHQATIQTSSYKGKRL